ADGLKLARRRSGQPRNKRVNVPIVRINAEPENCPVQNVTDVLVDQGQEAESTDGDEGALQQFEDRDEADTTVERATHSTSVRQSWSPGKHGVEVASRAIEVRGHTMASEHPAKQTAGRRSWPCWSSTAIRPLLRCSRCRAGPAGTLPSSPGEAEVCHSDPR